jgi:hypothetical protein
MRKLLFAFAAVWTFHTAAFAQFPNSTAPYVNKMQPSSGLTYEALTKYLQSTVTTGKDGGFDFKSSLFSLKRLLKGDSLLPADVYKLTEASRKLEFSLGVHKGSSGDLNAVSTGLKYAIVNNRDRSKINFGNILENKLKTLNIVRGTALKLYDNFIQGLREKRTAGDSALAKRLEDGEEDSLKLYAKNQHDPRYLPTVMRNYMDSVLQHDFKTSTADYIDHIQKAYNDEGKKIDKRGLFTISASSGYDCGSGRYSTTNVLLRYLKGFGSTDKPLDLDAQAKYQWENDSIGKFGNLGRSFFATTLGLNKLLVRTNDDNPILEFEFAGEYDYISTGRYDAELGKQNKVMAVATFRVHISKETAIPITVKYDVDKHNLFGFLQLQWNLESSSK